jgi:1-pyrroline-4-hydroxy-2-carboxylate deaminase
MSFEWKGVFPALLTPFTRDEKLDLDMFEKNLAAQAEAGVHGIILGGSLGEASTITEKEKEELVEFSVEYLNEDIPVIMNIAESTTADAIKQADNARKWGADGIMLLPPMRYKTDDRETITYFKAVANSTALPVMIYNNPHDYKIDCRPEMFDELIECANITALKESSRDVTNLTRMKNRFGERVKVLCGVDTLAMEELCLGADGWVAGLVDAFPKETVAVYNFVKAGELEEAIRIYRWFMPLLELDIHSKLVQYIKLAATQTGISNEFVRAPRLTLVGDERERILKVINDAIKNRPVIGQLSVSNQ